ncbi:MAG: 3-dehydroquinate dehydratase [Bacteroidetes bacterium GWC2_33_15]|nr:MAG: 3-dehydroquinate dehydratase [Bacteroidetes bacterium GWA2_33_15]OFX51778.1 MAG: 3-dehydroquinate dehydratase [Bacteroidetes bacterium GWC2_33_15]OFX66850.1 MAG: 3-dehydroquinate dehydratase [Bacteroidetes bacterium GWB2_32_14]OFX67108.1 MAG: 3-dehydroquinate dehydratase [Bacteroidetes bacterium GWD2_33_33]HAN17199.1 3-dehydroquinate dehydratase [Bacteroidales bacterium]
MKTSKIAIINGPNINMLGIREPEHYGNVQWKTIEQNLTETFDTELLFYQSNHMGNIVDYIQSQYLKIDGIIINPASFSTIGYPILDAIKAINVPFVEVHISNIFSRGGWHSESVFLQDAVGVIVGFKNNVYSLAVQAILSYLNIKK